MSILDRPFEFTGELSDDMKSVKIDQASVMARLLIHFKEKRLQVKIQLLRFKRSLAQNRWLWGVSHVRVASFLKETQGETYDKETIHDFSIQHILNDGSSGKAFCFDIDEFKTFCDEFYDLAHKKPKDWVLGKVFDYLKPYMANLVVKEIFDKRVISNSEYKTTSKLTTKEFNLMKEKIQKFWSEKGCVIPDPNQNNFISDHIKDE